ncbi:SPOR domain-containing protein [Reinekea marinisedimentorum]|uniref:Sporulation related protein n=1 Tax=Reinekea marinisedimentorum TaxID=230495 RepID=A0A4R3IEI6_9GAMM|nr:SPOR domain-containing protein [Reinekea marinisedimentorum]TCS43201.1 sporulation related protein [Reinekea marinisedimentorum]
MARDFANKPRPEPKRSRVPRWVWVFTFVVATGFVGFLYFLSHVPEETGGAEAVREQLTAALENTEKPAPKATTETPKHETLQDLKDKAETMKKAFEFYELLENEEVSIDLPSDANREVTPGSAASREATVTEEPTSWIIQVASFRSVADADRARAELILNGLPSAEIQSVEVAGKGTYHRVVVGPFEHRPSLNKAQDILADLNYQPLVKKL